MGATLRAWYERAVGGDLVFGMGCAKGTIGTLVGCRRPRQMALGHIALLGKRAWEAPVGVHRGHGGAEVRGGASRRRQNVRNGFSGASEDLPPEVVLTPGYSDTRPGTLVEREGALDGATVAFRALALARLERDHAALLAAVCELEADASKSARTYARARARGTTAALGGVAAPAANALALRDALMVLLRDDLRQTQRALGRAALGDYGRCEMCHAELDLRTLLVQPAVTRCGHCAAAAERARQVH